MADSTLDEIIKQKRQQRFASNKQNKRVNQNQNQNQKVAPRIQGKAMMNKRGRLYKEVQKDLGITTKQATVSIKTDARNRIIKNKRIKYKDARDRLAQIAKQGDARDKLNLMRKVNPGEKVVQQKKTVVKKKIANVPKQALQTGQTRIKGAALVRTVAGAELNRKKKIILRGQAGGLKTTGLVTRGKRSVARTQPLANRPGVITIKNNHAQAYDTVYQDVDDYRQELQVGGRTQQFAGMGVPTPLDTVMTVRPDQIMRGRPIEPLMYATEYEPEIRPSRLRITAANSEYRISGQQYVDEWQPQAWEPPTRMQQPRKRELYDEQVEYQVYPKKVQPVAAPQVQERGTKVVVSNLHPCVSVDDMEELFGTVGSILSVRMVRQGVAEAMFVNQEDAYRSVDLFNNRQLDGQPMKVMVVRKKALMPTPTMQSRSVLKSARGRTGYYIQ